MSMKEDNFVTSDNEEWDYDYSPTESEDEETVEVNGFQVLPSQEKLVRELFNKHPDLTSNFELENQQLKDSYMDVLLDLMETLSQSTNNLSKEDLNKADKTICDLTRAGLKVSWLREELDEAYLKKEKQRISESRIRELEELVKKRKLTLSNLESDLEKEKAVAYDQLRPSENIV